MVSMTPLNISFRRTLLVGERLDDWLNLVSLVVPFNLNENKDRFLAVEEMVNFLLNLYVGRS